MADPHLFVRPSASKSYDMVTLLAYGFKSPTFTASTSKNLGTVSVSGGTLTYKAGSLNGIDSVTVVIKDSEGSSWTRSVGVAIF
jgi:hypothetical protein